MNNVYDKCECLKQKLDEVLNLFRYELSKRKINDSTLSKELKINYLTLTKLFEGNGNIKLLYKIAQKLDEEDNIKKYEE